ncbi:hypothetical protein QYZ88_008065 [Lachnospiraceae bacterium C1.1]|nr:hypothetical protein [Lachnospiraceae bacterium C1.1]
MALIKRPVMMVNIIIVILELLAFIHDLYAFQAGLFRWYTIDSNLLQLFVSVLVVIYCFKGTTLPDFVTILHFISAVGLTVTFLIAAFVLAPEGGVTYYFIQDVAPINHLIGPALSIISLLFLEKAEKLPIRIILYPTYATLFYGLVCLVLNALRIMDGPYFFLKIYSEKAGTIILWFMIITVMCLLFSFAYFKIKWRKAAS